MSLVDSKHHIKHVISARIKSPKGSITRNGRSLACIVKLDKEVVKCCHLRQREEVERECGLLNAGEGVSVQTDNAIVLHWPGCVSAKGGKGTSQMLVSRILIFPWAPFMVHQNDCWSAGT